MLGVREYFLYDPLGEYLRPPLQGYRLLQGEYERVLPGDQGQLVSQALSLELRLQDGQLQVVNPATGERLLTPAEAHAARRTEAEARQVKPQHDKLPRHVPRWPRPSWSGCRTN